MCRKGKSLQDIEDRVTQFYGDFTYRARNIRELIRRRNLS
jgi:hypothetical protein